MTIPPFKDRICAVVAARTSAAAHRQFRSAQQVTRTMEIRLDWFRDGPERMKFTADIKSRGLGRNRTLIATCRRKEAGGLFRGSIPAEFLALSRAAGSGCSYVDLAVESLPESPRELVAGLRSGALCVVSYHNFEETPSAVEKLAAWPAKVPFQVLKIATRCNSYADGLRLLALCERRSNVIAVPMGDIGLPLRVLALRAGSALAYASVGEKTAPGQLTLDEMKKLYRADRLDKKTRVYGVIGNPVFHSLSPLMQNRAFRQKRLNAVFLPFLVPDLKDFLRAVPELGIAGFSVTIPHKERILEHLDECDPLAARIGAVNTIVVRRSGRLYGCNTDYVGVLRALESRITLRGSRVLLCGAGGAARAAAFALSEAGSRVCICARKPGRAAALARAVGGEAVPRAALRRQFFDAVVNATPVGMSPREGRSPLRAGELNCRLVFDTIYRPLRTRLLRLAEGRGIATVSGLEMFVAQGAAQFEIWTGKRAPVALMRRAAWQALQDDKQRR